jgi:hypothetical protein
MRRLTALPLLIMVGIGVAWNNAAACWRGLTCWGGTFARTPKFRVEGKSGRWLDSDYRLDVDTTVIGESALTAYALVSIAIAHQTGRYAMVPFLLLYAAAFGTVAAIELTQGLSLRRATRSA